MRPGTENDEDLEETIQTCVLSDVRPGSSPSPTSPSPSVPPSSKTPPPSSKTPPTIPPRPHITNGSNRSRSSSGPAKIKEDPEASLITDPMLGPAINHDDNIMVLHFTAMHGPVV